MDGAWLKTIFTFQIPIENENHLINTELCTNLWELPSRDQYFCFCVFAVIEEVQDYGQSKNNLETEEQHGAHAKSLTVVHYNNFDITVYYQKNFCTLMLIFLYEESKVEFYIPNDCFTNDFHPILITN